MTSDALLNIQLTRIPTDRFAADEMSKMRFKLKAERFEAFSGPFSEINRFVLPVFLDNSEVFLRQNLADAFNQIQVASQKFTKSIAELSETIHQYGMDRTHYFSSAIATKIGIRKVIWSLADLEERLQSLSEERIQDYFSGVHDALYTFIEEPLLDFENGFSSFKSDHTYLDLIKRIPMINDERNIIGEKIAYVSALIGNAVDT